MDRENESPSFRSSVNLKYVKLGYAYLVSHYFYFFPVIAPPLILTALFGATEMFSWKIGSSLSWEILTGFRSFNGGVLLGVAAVVVVLTVVCVDLLAMNPGNTYLVDFACYCPPDEFKVSKDKFMKTVANSAQSDKSLIEFQHRLLHESGIGDETYLPQWITSPSSQTPPSRLKEGRSEAALVMFGAVDALLAATNLHPSKIGILVVNCGVLNTTPSLSAMIVNHYKLHHSIHSFNLGGMGCAAGLIAIDLAHDLLAARTGFGTYALVISTEVVSATWYLGFERRMVLPNCFFRMGAAAVLLSNKRMEWWRAKYVLNQVVRVHHGAKKRSFECVVMKEDKDGNQGIYVDDSAMEVGMETVRACLKVAREKENAGFDHVCVQASGKKVLDAIGEEMDLTREKMDASRETLRRFGNTSSSSVWYELGYLEAARDGIGKGHRVCQIAFGSGFKCSIAVWTALRKNVARSDNNPWLLLSKKAL